jgi:hypothetical protein
MGGVASDVVAGAWYNCLDLVVRKEEAVCTTVAVVVVMFGIWYVLGFWP